MKTGPNGVRVVYRWAVVACATLITSLLISLLFPSVALALEGSPHTITRYSGCGLLVASLLYVRLRDPLFLIGLVVGISAILVSWIPALVRA
jgi:hypothetical protein